MIIKKIYYINLEKDKLRRSIVEANIALIFPYTPFERIDAIWKEDKKIFEDNVLNRLTKSWLPVEGKYPKPGGIGCYLSHQISREKIIDSLPGCDFDENDFYMVIEDDCIIGDEFLTLISNKKFLDSIPTDARILKPVSRKFDESHKINDFFYDVSLSKELDYNYYFGAHMLLYRASKINLTCNDLDKLPIFDIDWLINKRISGVYAFGRDSKSFVTQSNLNGSNTLEINNG